MSRARRSSRRRRRFRRLLVLGVLGGLAADVARRRRDRPAIAPASAPQWPAFTASAPGAKEPPAATVLPIRDANAPTEAVHAESAGAPGRAMGFLAAEPSDAPWVDPVDGECPLSHPVKGNASSRIYHVPGSRHFARTVPERCYRDAAAAEADGMRAPKR